MASEQPSLAEREEGASSSTDPFRIKKQNYLREEIIQKGQDPEEFMAFLKNQKPNGENIDVWSLNDLETMVDLFKRTLDQPGQYSLYKLQEIDLSDSPDELYTKRVHCETKPTTPLEEFKESKVEVSLAEKVEGGLFSSSFVFFSIKLSQKEESIKRKATDFVWLRDNLLREFPLSYIPTVTLTENKPQDNLYIEDQVLDFQVDLS